MTYFGFIFATLVFRIDSLILIVLKIIFLQRKTTSMHKFTKYITGGHLHIFSKICIIKLRLGVLKTFLWDPRCQTYVFESRIAQGIQIWVQNNKLLTPWLTLPSTICFKKLFSAQKNHQKNKTFC